MASTYHLVKYLQSASPSKHASRKRKEQQLTQKCRVCLQKGQFPIFCRNNYFYIPESLKVICDIDVTSAKDGYPQYVCKSCFDTLQAALKLRNTAKNTQLKLKEMCMGINLSKKGKISQTESEEQQQEVVSAVNKKDTTHKIVIKLEAMHNIKEEVDISKDCECSIEMDKDLEEHKSEDKLKLQKSCSYMELSIEPKLGIMCRRELEEIDKMEYYDRMAKNLLEKENKPELKIISPCETNKTKRNDNELEHHGDDDVVDEEWSNYIDKLKKQPEHISEMRDRIDLKKYFKKVFALDKTPVYECHICKKVFKKPSKSHMIEHIPDYAPQHVCEICGRAFKKYNDFYQHQYRHSNELLYKCNICPYRGRSKDQLRNHSKIHGQECKYLCTHCPRKFLNRSNLTRHLRRHAEPKFQCTVCQKSFYDNFTLKNHVNSQHGDAETFKCEICGNFYKSRKYLLSHELRIHKRKKKNKNRAMYLKLENEEESIKVQSN